MNMTVKVRITPAYFTTSKSVAGLKTFLCRSTRSFIHSVSDVMIMCVMIKVLVYFHVAGFVLIFKSLIMFKA